MMPSPVTICRAASSGGMARLPASRAAHLQTLADLVARMQRPGGVPVRDRSYHLRLYPECFIGAHLTCRRLPATPSCLSKVYLWPTRVASKPGGAANGAGATAFVRAWMYDQ